MRRAKYELTKLLSRAPEKAEKRVGDSYSIVSVDEVMVGDELMVKTGQIIPVDGVVVSGGSFVDESNITGESIPVEKIVGSLVVSGTENTSGVLVIRATKRAQESRYTKIVDLVKKAQDSRAPMVRLADRYAVVFTAITLVFAIAAYFVSGDGTRVLAVLVVATPCPLILATPIAIISGMSRLAKKGVIVKDGGHLEVLSRVKTIMFDKTGTITLGTPDVVTVEFFSHRYSPDQLVSYSASLDHGSSHILARSLERYAAAQKVKMVAVDSFTEQFGEGVTGSISSSQFFLGKLSFIQEKIPISQEVHRFRLQQKELGHMTVLLADRQEVLAGISFSDTLRTDAQKVFRKLSEQGIHSVMVTGDHKKIAEMVAESSGIPEVHADCEPEDKVRMVLDAVQVRGPVAMVGDGINDAPALAAANVGIAIASHGDTATSDAAGIVILHGSLYQMAELFTTAQKTIRIAQQGIWVGMGLSILAMVAALLGYIDPLLGALLQEGIDVFVILGALRALII
jgi:heavy metal translocating P-type ATPase